MFEGISSLATGITGTTSTTFTHMNTQDGAYYQTGTSFKVDWLTFENAGPLIRQLKEIMSQTGPCAL